MLLTSFEKFKLAVNLSLLLLALALLARGYLVDSSVATRAMADEGYTNVHIRSRSVILEGFNGCSGHDAVAFEVDAQNSVGQYVTVNVCCGYPFMGCLIRH